MWNDVKACLPWLLTPFVLGVFVGAAVVAAATDRTYEHHLRRAEALSREQGRICTEGVQKAEAALVLTILERRKGCFDGK